MTPTGKHGAIFGGFSRLQDFPLDNTSVFETEAEFREYITKNDQKPTTAYVGQIVSIKELNGLFYIKELKTSENQFKDCYFKLADIGEISSIHHNMATLEGIVTSLIFNLKKDVEDTQNLFYTNKAETAGTISSLNQNVSNVFSHYMDIQERITTLSTLVNSLNIGLSSLENNTKEDLRDLENITKKNITDITILKGDTVTYSKLNESLNNLENSMSDFVLRYISTGNVSLKNYPTKDELQAELDKIIGILGEDEHLPETLDTIKEIADVIQENGSTITEILSGIASLTQDLENLESSKANKTELPRFKVDISSTTVAGGNKYYLNSISVPAAYVTKDPNASGEIGTGNITIDTTNDEEVNQLIEDSIHSDKFDFYTLGENSYERNYVVLNEHPYIQFERKNDINNQPTNDYLIDSITIGSNTYNIASGTDTEEVTSIINGRLNEELYMDNDGTPIAIYATKEELEALRHADAGTNQSVISDNNEIQTAYAINNQGATLKKISIMFPETSKGKFKTQGALEAEPQNTPIVYLNDTNSANNPTKTFVVLEEFDYEFLNDENSEFPVTFEFDILSNVPAVELNKGPYLLVVDLEPLFEENITNETNLGSVNLIYT